MRLVTWLIALLWSVSVLAADFGNTAVSRIVSVYDADTFRADIDSWPAIVGSNMPVRVNGVDAPEIRGKCPSEKLAAKAARDFTSGKLLSARLVELRNIERGKYFRLLADVYVDGLSLADLLISAGHARPYDGGRRDGWCD